MCYTGRAEVWTFSPVGGDCGGEVWTLAPMFILIGDKTNMDEMPCFSNA